VYDYEANAVFVIIYQPEKLNTSRPYKPGMQRYEKMVSQQNYAYCFHFFKSNTMN